MDQAGTQQLKSQARGEIWTVDFPDGRQEMFVKVTITCPACGNIEFQISGHHVLTILHILSNAAEQHPGLVHSTIKELSRSEFVGTPSKDPSVN